MQTLAFLPNALFFLNLHTLFYKKKQTDEQITIVGYTFCMHAVFVWG